jgi:hypothetical protein
MEIIENTQTKRPTLGEVQALKTKHGEIYEIEVQPGEIGGETLVFLFKRPDRKTLSATAKIAQSDPVQAAVVMLTNCLVWGEVKHFDDMAVFQSVSSHFEEINKARESTLKKL